MRKDPLFNAGSILTCGKDHLLKVVDVTNFQVKQELRSPGFQVGNTWCSAAMAADERHVAAGSTDGTVFVWEVRPKPEIAEFCLCGQGPFSQGEEVCLRMELVALLFC